MQLRNLSRSWEEEENSSDISFCGIILHIVQSIRKTTKPFGPRDDPESSFKKLNPLKWWE